MEGSKSSSWYNDLAQSELPDDKKRELVKSLTLLFGKVHRMNKGELISHLKEYDLPSGGSRDVLVKRLKNHYRVQKLASVNIVPTVKHASYYLVLDFEATCNTVNAPDYPHEIIEFPAVLIDSKERKVVDTFQEYVKPKINDTLSDFCVKLTGISQATVNAADTFQIVLEKFEKWMSNHGLLQDDFISEDVCVLVTDGPWDMAQFFHGQCVVAGLEYPKWAKKWLNIRKSFRNYYKLKMNCNLKGMLVTLGMEFEGRPHCGLDDARNIARILLTLVEEHVPLQVNERLRLKDYRSRKKALLLSVVATVKENKKIDSMGDLLLRLGLELPEEDNSNEKNGEENTDSEEDKCTNEECAVEGSSDSDHNEDEDSILWTNNKFSALRKHYF